MRYTSLSHTTIEWLNKWYEEVVGYKPSDERPELTRDELAAEILEYVEAVYEDKGVDTVPLVELKNVKHNERLSEETHCFSAAVYLDGVRVCEVGNRGHGGEDEFHAFAPKGGYSDVEDSIRDDREMMKHLHDARWRFKLFGELRPCSWDESETMRDSLESVICDKVNEFLMSKDMRNAFRRKWIYSQSGKADGDLYECARKKGHKGETMQEVIRKQHPAAVVLNILDTSEALKFWRECA